MITRDTKLFGILGYPLGHTLSPLLHNTLFELSKFPGIYLVLENQNWQTMGLGSLEALQFKGLSVTIPFKEWAFSQAKTSCSASQLMKASNTLYFNEGKWEATNTDGLGALRAVQETDPTLVGSKNSLPILILGSGGSAKGIAYALRNATNSYPQDLYFLARNQTSTEDIQDLLKDVGNGNLFSITLEQAMDRRKEFGLIVHTTPVGMKGWEGRPILPEAFFEKHHCLFDIVYNPMKTDLVAYAQKRKANVILGYKMLLYQGIAQFEIFTKLKAKQKWIEKVDKLLLQALLKRK